MVTAPECLGPAIPSHGLFLIAQKHTLQMPTAACAAAAQHAVAGKYCLLAHEITAARARLGAATARTGHVGSGPGADVPLLRVD
jgi:hypothetical protein